MKKGIKLGSFLIIITLTLAPASSDAFNPLAHIFIAENACSSCSSKIDCYYGSNTPDIAWHADSEKWPTAAYDTHEDEDTIDLRGFASGSTQMAFSIGWLTHRYADYFAHDAYSESPVGYVEEKAGELVDKMADLFPELKLTPEFAHYIIEAIIDFLLKGDHPTLPGKLFFSNLCRSWEDRNLLMKVFVWRWPPYRKTNWIALATAEWTYRQLLNRYALPLMLQAPNDKEALARLGSELAEEMFGLDIDPGFLEFTILPEAIALCEEDKDYNGNADYLDAINQAIEAVSDYLN